MLVQAYLFSCKFNNFVSFGSWNHSHINLKLANTLGILVRKCCVLLSDTNFTLYIEDSQLIILIEELISIQHQSSRSLTE